MIDADVLLRRARCGSCRAPVAGCRCLNLVELLRRAKWKYPTAGNVISGEHGRAIAVLCDACMERSPRPEILEAVETTDDDQIRYHPIDSLEEVREPRCRVCGCTDHDCMLCVERTGQPCEWVEEDLCSACPPGDEAAVQAFRQWHDEWEEMLLAEDDTDTDLDEDE